ncbi:rRNA maturation RNase YbeY [filamentous cyanobacterium CCP5]|nr:rRNA maturation RNase YbeY [filamentous cyanobacterium CCP5]
MDSTTAPATDAPVRSLTLDLNGDLPSPLSPEEWQGRFDSWAIAIPKGLSPIEAYEVGLTLTDDAEIQSLNRTYRHQDKPTDVLAFAALEDTPLIPELLTAEPLPLGDIVISLETAQRQAQEAGHSLTQELVWLAAHGFLHLLGWDHPDEASLKAMLDRQRELIQIFPVEGKKSS